MSTQNLRLAAYSPNSLTRLGFLPDVTDLSMGVPVSGVASLSFTYPWNGKNANLLGQPCDIVPELEFGSGSGGTYVEYPNTRFLYLRDDRDPANKGPYQVEGVGNAVLFSKAVVPSTNLDLDGRRTFTAVTIGSILGTLFTEAQARGALSGLTWDFTATQDSQGDAWTSAQTPANISFDPGKDFLSIIQDWADQGLIDYQMNSSPVIKLQMYVLTRTSAFSKTVTGTLAPDQGASRNIVLKAGRDLQEVPTQRSWEGLMSAAMVQGDNDVLVTRTNGTTPWGRWETYVSAGGVDDTTELNKIGDNALAGGSSARVQKTIGLTMNPVGPIPLSNYSPGAYVGIQYDTNTGGLPPLIPGLAVNTPESVRIQQVNLSVGADGFKGSLVLQDPFPDADGAVWKAAANAVPLRSTSGMDATGVPPTDTASDTFGGIGDAFNGAWGTAAATPTSGRAYVLPAGVLRCHLTATGYSTTGAALIIQVYLDGVFATSMNLAAALTANAHLALGAAAFTATIAAGTHYIYFRQTSGTSDATDQGAISATVLPA